jgi:hypothetical protein
MGKATTGWVVSLDNAVSKEVIEPVYFDNGFRSPDSVAPFIPDREIVEWRKKDKILILKNKSFIGFRSNESKGKFPGAAKDWIHFDEPPSIKVYEESTMRIPGGKGRKLRIFGTCTLLPPEGTIGGISWIFSEIVRKIENLPHTAIFRGSIYDNPHLNPDEIKILENKHPEGTPARRIRLNGELIPGIGGSRVYNQFERCLHVKKGLTFYTKLPLCWTWDFNVDPMVCLVGQHQGDIFRVFREIVLEEGNIFEMVEEFRRLYPTHGAAIHLYGDASGGYRSEQTNKTNFNLIMRAMASYPVPVKQKVPELNPHVVDRINGVNAILKDENGMCRLEIDPGCHELIQDFEEVLTDNKGGIKKSSNKRDPYYKRTHMTDALGYWLHKDEPPRRTSVFRKEGLMSIPKVPKYVWQ